MSVVLVLSAVVLAAVSFAGDRYLAKHPLKKLDAKSEKYRYRGF